MPNYQRNIIEFGRKKRGLTVEPIIVDGIIDFRKEGHCILVFADKDMTIFGVKTNHAIVSLNILAKKGDMIKLLHVVRFTA